MRKSLNELWAELLLEPEQPTPTTNEMVLHGINLFFPNIDKESARFKQNYEIFEGWYKEFREA